MYRVRNFIRNVKRVWYWLPIIWKDRDWDYYYIYEMLKQKLIKVEQYILKDGIHIYNDVDAANIRTAINMIEKVQNEYYLDQYLMNANELGTENMMKAVEDHDKAKQELFKFLADNIDSWWD